MGECALSGVEPRFGDFAIVPGDHLCPEPAGAMRDPKTGRFAKNPAKAAEPEDWRNPTMPQCPQDWPRGAMRSEGCGRAENRHELSPLNERIIRAKRQR